MYKASVKTDDDVQEDTGLTAMSFKQRFYNHTAVDARPKVQKHHNASAVEVAVCVFAEGQQGGVPHEVVRLQQHKQEVLPVPGGKACHHPSRQEQVIEQAV